MKHLILGTAGHVDHGKTALIRALTGIECDTHKEERERGITIHLGFAHLTLPSGDRLGIVDVPGHRDFIHTMVSGATGIDLVLLVIAADSGVMPQTREHLQIMEILGLRQGIVVLTKIDLVDAETLEICEFDVREFLAGTCLAAAPVVKVSAKTGAGLDALRQAIATAVAKATPRDADGLFRLYVDRVFSVSGFGTVVTGTVIGGRLRREETVVLQGSHPQTVRVRRLERHGQAVEAVQAGDRASLNLAGIERTAIARGDLLAGRELPPTAMFDATLRLHAPHRELGLWSQAILHAGTFERQARIHLIDKDRLRPGESAIVQIHVDKPVFLQHGDRFVLRTTSCDLTLGGGEVIDAAPLHHRRRPERLVQELNLIAQGKLDELIALEVRKAGKPLTLGEIADRLHVAPERVQRALDEGRLTSLTSFETGEGPVLLAQVARDQMRATILAVVTDYRQRHRLSSRGIDLDELRSVLRFEHRPAHDEVILAILRGLAEKEKVREHERSWLPFDDRGEVDPRLRRAVAAVERYMAGCGLQTPLLTQIKAVARQEGVGEKDVGAILHHLVATGRAVKIEQEHLHRQVVDACREKLVAHLRQTGRAIKVSEFRDLIGGNRKICLLLLNHFDAEGITVRQGDDRILHPRWSSPPAQEDGATVAAEAEAPSTSSEGSADSEAEPPLGQRFA